MSQPTAYEPETNFSTFLTAQHQFGLLLDAEFVGIQLTTDEIRANLLRIQRDDGRLANSSVHYNAVEGPLLSLLTLSRFNPRGLWVTLREYAIGDIVERNLQLYLCTVAHVAGDFDVDRSNILWVYVGAMTESMAQELADAQAAAAAALVSQNAAAASATSAATSATTATTQATNAAASAADANTAKAAAELAEAHAETAEVNAETAETNAAASAVAAAASATTAQQAADSVIWQDVEFLTFADSPKTLVAGDRGKLFAIDTSGGAVVVNMPTIAGLDLSTPWTVALKKTTSDANTVTANRGGTDTIDGATSKVITAQNEGAVFVPDTGPSPDIWTTAGFGAGIADGSITYAKIQNVSTTKRALGRKTAGAGVVEEMTTSELLDFLDTMAQGDILYRGAATWARLAAGTSGQFLKTLGAGANPAWDAAGGGETRVAEQACASGATNEFNGLPAGIKGIIFFLWRVSTTADDVLVQLRVGGAYVTSGYTGGANDGGGVQTATAGFSLTRNNAAANTLSGFVTLRLVDAATDKWESSCNIFLSSGDVHMSAGEVDLAGDVDGVRILNDAAGSFDGAGTTALAYWS